jgi:hypothetical protein
MEICGTSQDTASTKIWFPVKVEQIGLAIILQIGLTTLSQQNVRSFLLWLKQSLSNIQTSRPPPQLEITQ